jgi:hypothetical protein
MELRCHRLEIAKRDIRWQLAVQCLLEAPGGHATGERECDHLSKCVDAGVRSAGPVDRLANPVSEARQRGFEFPLDRPDPGPLGLEAGKVRAVIFNPSSIPLTGRRRGDALSSASFVVR